ncbi:MAG: hypothetical protein AB7S26_21330 [Sandaracinaceae bacterium]
MAMMLAGLAPGAASAQADAEEDEEVGALDSPSDTEGEAAMPEEEEEPEAPQRLDDEQSETVDEAPTEQFADTTDPRELPDTDYFFLGAMGRGVIIPGFIQQLFVQGGIDGFNPGVGASFNWRRNNFNVVANVWWNNAVGDGYFRANGDPPSETEYIDVDLGVIFINAEFLWSFPLTDWFAIELGFDIGLGFIYGDLVRTEAYETAPDQYAPCDGPGAPANPFCEPTRAPDPCYANNGGHYACREPNWFTQGGDTPFVFPWVSLPHLAVRFKPIRQVQIRIDGGYGLYNFFFGGSVYYGF